MMRVSLSPESAQALHKSRKWCSHLPISLIPLGIKLVSFQLCNPDPMRDDTVKHAMASSQCLFKVVLVEALEHN